MAQKSSIVSKLLKIGIPDFSGQDFDKNFLDSEHVLMVYFKPSRKNQDFWFLPLPSKLGFMKNDHFYQYRASANSLLSKYILFLVQCEWPG